MSSHTITLFGSALCPPGSADYEVARRLGRAIAEAGWTVCNGGYGGTMEAAARGAREAGGHTIGVTCRVFDRPGPNPYVVQEVPTFDLFARLDTLMRLGDAYVVLPGGTGTLLELALVWEFANKGLLSPRRPIILLGGQWSSTIEAVLVEQPAAIRPPIAVDAESAMAALREALASR